MAFEIESGTILTNEQLQNHAKIYAGPGAGKTHFLVENVKNIAINDSTISKSNMRKVLCITYTNAAVEEITYRLNRFGDSVEIFTIHGFIIEHIIKPFQIDLRRIIKEQFDIDIQGNKSITSQIEGVGILHGVDKEEIYKFIVDETGDTTSPTYSKKLMGDVKIDNHKYKEEFGIKAKMLRAEQTVELIGHAVGGICPFGINEGVAVYLDESMKRFKTMFPACGSSNSAIELTIGELEKYSGYKLWVNVCKNCQ